MVAGGPFGLEDIVSKSGYAGAILILLITPVIWSLPTALMVSELASAIPEDGGYYVWVTRGMGNFWGFQEAWLSLVAACSIWLSIPRCLSAIWATWRRR